MNKLILICGDYQVGKSTFAKKLENNIPNSINISLANKIRQTLKVFLSIPEFLLYEKPTPQCIRDLIKGYGTYIKEYIDKDYWCNLVLEEFIFSKKEILIIDDFRFIHEFEFFNKRFKKLDIIYIGDVSNNYDLKEIYNIASIKLNSKPDLETFIKNDRLL